MSQLVLTAHSSNKALMIKATLTLGLVHLLAEAFTDKYDNDSAMHGLLTLTFGRSRYRWYAVDMSGEIWTVTFSNLANPPMLLFNKMPAQIACAEWTLRLQEVELVRPGRINPNTRHPHFIDKA